MANFVLQDRKKIYSNHFTQVPSGRLFHAAAIVGDAMYVFGGTVDNNIRSGEMYRFQLAAFPKCTLQEDFGRLLESKQFTDVSFLLGPSETRVDAHISLVVARSNFLLNKIREARPKGAEVASNGDHLEVAIPDANAKAFQLVLDFIYTDQIDPTRGQKELAASNEVVLLMMQVFTLVILDQEQTGWSHSKIVVDYGVGGRSLLCQD